ncbi:MAG: 2-oxoacid:acceptor oxidoreductase subunit alpha [Thermomicrobiales bacterium]
MAHKNDFVIRIGGEAGEGVQSTGDLAVQVAARAGYYVLTHRVPPAEIKGGLYEYQIRLANGPLHSQGDELDILLAFNEEAYQSGIQVLKPDGLLIYDSAEFTPPADNPFRTVPLPLTDIAKTQLKFALGKNVVAVGAVGALFGLPIEYGQALLQERFGRKGEEIVAKNIAALEAGIEYVKSHVPGYENYQLARTGEEKPDVIVVTGSQAVGLGTLAAGCRHVFGYPITPASDVLEWLASELPKVGGVVVQAEDELAAMAMVVGAGYSGVKSMTPTSGPGISLMTELLGLAVMAEIPLVLVDVQRAGPSTGMPTRHEQGDLYHTALGGHGEVPRIVIACTSVEDSFYQTVNAFNLAEKYQVPVFFMSDTSLGTRSEAIPRPDLATLEIINRQTLSSVSANGDGNGQGFYHFEDNGRYKRYNLESPTGVNPMPIPGEAGGEYVATGLEHNEYGRVRYDVTAHSTMTDKRFRKMEAAVLDAPALYRYGDPDAEVGIITWGSTAGTCTEAIDRLREQGIAVDMIAPKMLWPLPMHQLEPFITSKRRVLVVEVNHQGQFADLITARMPGDYERINTYGGVPFTVAEICEAVVGKPVAVAAD